MRGESVGFGAAPVSSGKAAGLFASLKLNNTSATPQRKIARGSLVAEADSGTNARMKFMAMSKLSIQSVRSDFDLRSRRGLHDRRAIC
jgi:hypothetical protein